MPHWSERFLWIHAAGLAALPITLGLSTLGLAVGDPLLPWLELLLVGGVGIVPILWMQWQRPFDIFSLLVVALKPEQLTSDQRRILSLFKTKEERLLAITGAIAAALLLWQLYKIAPIASGVLPFQARPLGLLVAAGAFLASNLFLQVPLSALRVLLTRSATIQATEPYPVERIRQNFTLLGLQVKQILPPLELELDLASATSPPKHSKPTVQETSSTNDLA